MKELLKAPGFKKWFDSRPKRVQALIRLFPPNRLYRIKDSGPAYGPLFSWSEEGGSGGKLTVKVDIVYDTQMPRQVFGVEPEDLIDAGPWDYRPE